MELPSIEKRSFLFGIGVIMGGSVAGISLLLFLSMDLSKSVQAQVFATLIGALGTLALASATVYNIFQTNRNIEMREKERERPLAKEELSLIIQPALESLRENLEQMQESEQTGCSFDWVYINEPSLYHGSRGPQSVGHLDIRAPAKRHMDDPLIYGDLGDHDKIVIQIADQATQFHEEITPELRRLLKEYGYSPEDYSLKVLSNAILKELDYFGEDHDMSEFWGDHREHLIQYANEEIEPTLDNIKSGEDFYYDIVRKSVEELQAQKQKIKLEYGISDKELMSRSTDDWKEW